MKVDPEYLRRHYESLSDEALLDIKRSDLVEVAQRVYENEISRRGLDRPRAARQAAPIPAEADLEPVEEMETDEDFAGEEDAAEWVGEAAEVYSAVVHPGLHEDERVADARSALKAEGIPVAVDLVEVTPEDGARQYGTHRRRVLVPWKHSYRAASVIEREFSNPDFEAGWRAHLEACMNDDLVEMDPRIVFSGLFDRIERVTKAWEEEIARRGIE